MSYDVERSFRYYWQPGDQPQAMLAELERRPAQTPLEQQAVKALRADLRWCQRNKDLIKLVMLALAFDANPIDLSGSTAMTWISVASVADQVGRSDRTVQRVLHRLAEMREIDIRPCDGMHCSKYHQLTNHYFLYRPELDPREWGPPDSGVLRKQRNERKARLRRNGVRVP